MSGYKPLKLFVFYVCLAALMGVSGVAQAQTGIGERRIQDYRTPDTQENKRRLFVAPRRLTPQQQKVRDESYNRNQGQDTKKSNQVYVPQTSGQNEPLQAGDTAQLLEQMKEEAQAGGTTTPKEPMISPSDVDVMSEEEYIRQNPELKKYTNGN